jgi:hypothetical protein
MPLPAAADAIHPQQFPTADNMQTPSLESHMRIKVRDGTPIDGESSLCSTCRCSTIVRGRSLDEELVFCNALSLHGVQITFKVTSCSDYADSRTPSYLEMMQDAWILRPGTRKRPAGFVRSSELQEEERFDLRSSLSRKGKP